MGWRIFVFFVIAWGVAGFAFAIVLVILRLTGHLSGAPAFAIGTTIEARRLLPAEVLLFIGVVTAMVIMGRREHRTLADFGFPWRRLFAGPFFAGLALGFGAIAAVMLAMIATGSAHVTSAAGGVPAAGEAALWAVTFLFVALTEELAFRGYPLFTLTRNMNFWRGAVAMTIPFTLLHGINPGESLLGVAGTFAVGMLFCFALRRLGDLRWPIGFHAAWNWGETAFFGTPDSGLFASGSILHTDLSGPAILSGGSAGPEASIFAFLALAAVGWLLQRQTANRKADSDRPLA